MKAIIWKPEVIFLNFLCIFCSKSRNLKKLGINSILTSLNVLRMHWIEFWNECPSNQKLETQGLIVLQGWSTAGSVIKWNAVNSNEENQLINGNSLVVIAHGGWQLVDALFNVTSLMLKLIIHINKGHRTSDKNSQRRLIIAFNYDFAFRRLNEQLWILLVKFYHIRLKNKISFCYSLV